MTASKPEYLLFTESLRHAAGDRVWRFLLLELGTDNSITATDVEPNCSAARAELLALVRGLEAIDRPGKVKHISGSNYVNRGLARGLRQWKAQGWHWERFGSRVPVRDMDLWQRVDHALQFHQLMSQTWSKPEITALSTSSAPQSARSATSPAVIVRSATTSTSGRLQADPAVMIVRRPRQRMQGTGLVATAYKRAGELAGRMESLLDRPLAAAS